MMRERWQRLERSLTAASIVVTVAWVLLLMAAKYPQWWVWVNAETSPMTWAEATLLWSAGGLALIAGLILYRDGRRQDGDTWLWLGVALTFLSMDERFHLHESLRDQVLAPHGIRLPGLSWVAPGDFILILYAIAGLAFLPRLWRALGARPALRRFFGTGAAIALAAVLLDAYDIHDLEAHWRQRLQFAEELLECSAQLCFFNGALWMVMGQLAPSAGESSRRKRP